MYDEDLTNLDEWIRRLKVEYDVYFNGNRRKPPDDLRGRVEKLVKQLSEVTDMNSAQRFRYTTLITRFYVLRDKWRRTQQIRESAGGAFEAPRLRTPLSQHKRPADTGDGGAEISISDPAAEASKVRRLYEELLRVKGSHTRKNPDVSFEQFSEYIASQTRAIRKKCKCASVTFRIAMEEKSIRFTAKADTSSSD